MGLRPEPYVTLAPVRSPQPRVGVVGHVEWVQFARVAHVPSAGEVVHAREPFEEPAGGGAVAAVQLARLAGAAAFVTALGEDGHGRRSVERLSELGVEVRASWRPEPTRRAVTLVDDAGERTITTIGDRLEPLGSDADAAWETLTGLDALYFTAGDLDALRAARRASRVLVASPRARDALGHGVELDVLLLSARDEIERREAGRAESEAELLVLTDGPRGGTYRSRSGESGSWQAVAPPGDPVDSYGCGDSFAGALTYALGAGMSVPDGVALAARCGAACLTGAGPYERQLGARDLRG
ncbi:MAG TPA: PfkB family carbohydrate kinase [Solirubrobacteraceae bacterium]|jgi:ribokinase|nr:PfkB family carbohydrate kinase [Solirubrobacteraceae bacterium]